MMDAIDAKAGVLVLVDYQARLMPAIHDAQQVVAHGVLLARAAHALGIPVIGTEQNPAGLGPNVEPMEGNALPLSEIPLGLPVHNIELYPGCGAKLVRGAGMAAQIMAREGEYAHVKLPSGEIRMINIKCYATIGQVGNLDHENVSLGKAGRKRWLGWRPTVRGVAMNPIDHPMGGGEGRTSGGGHPVSPWGQLAKGKKTRGPRKASRRFIVQRRK